MQPRCIAGTNRPSCTLRRFRFSERVIGKRGANHEWFTRTRVARIEHFQSISRRREQARPWTSAIVNACVFSAAIAELASTWVPETYRAGWAARRKRNFRRRNFASPASRSLAPKSHNDTSIARGGVIRGGKNGCGAIPRDGRAERISRRISRGVIDRGKWGGIASGVPFPTLSTVVEKKRS